MKNHPAANERILAFFRWFCHPDFQEEIEGDLLECFHTRLSSNSSFSTQCLLLRDVLTLLRPSLIRPFHPINHLTMFRQNLKISWRSLLKNKAYSLINISGLALGLCIAILVGLWLQEELQFDRHFENYDEIAQVMQHRSFDGTKQTWSSTMFPLAEVLRKDYGHLFQAVVKSSPPMSASFKRTNETFNATGLYFEPQGVDVFSLKMINGNAKRLSEPRNVLLSASFAERIFGTQDPIGESITLSDSLVQIMGIYPDFPVTSSFYETDYLGSWTLFEQLNPWITTMEVPWRPNSFSTFVQLAKQTDLAAANDAIAGVIAKHTSHIESVVSSKPETFLHPMSKWHLESRFENGVNTGGRIDNVWLFGIVGAFILLLACINFMNLSTARSEQRSKEVGVRKVLGSARSQLMAQFYSESLLTAGLAFVLALAFTFLALPGFNSLADKSISIPWASPSWWLVSFGVILLTGFVSGSYPALYLSSFPVLRAFRSGFTTGGKVVTPRRVLVVLQFTVAISLIIGVLMVRKQIEFGQSRPIGYQQEQLLMIPVNSRQIAQHYELLEEQINQLDQVVEISSAGSPITGLYSTSSAVNWRGKDPSLGVDFANTWVHSDFGKTIGWTIKDGRDFSSDLASDSSGIIFNEQAIELMGLEHPIGEQVQIYGTNYQIIGVVENMITNSPFQPVGPQFFYLSHGVFSMMHLKLEADGSTDQTLAQLEDILHAQDPEMEVNFSFVDEDYGRKVESEVRTGRLVGIFTLLAIFISCLGLFGLVAYIAERRRKEIGIRKVLGASVANLWQMLSKEFIWLVIISFAISIPISYYFINDWLAQYSYRTDISWQIFAFAGMLIFTVTLLTVSFQTVRAALLNPATAIKME